MHRKFIEIYDLYFDDLYKYLYIKAGNRWDTDDLVSEVFRKAYEKWSSLESNPKAWLFAIARNTFIDYLRKRHEVPSSEGMEHIKGTSAIPERLLESRETFSRLSISLKELDHDELEIINMKYFSNMNYDQIGKVMGKSPGSVKMRASRAIGKLRLKMEEYLGG